jgi:hypothetical protein
VAKAGSRSIPSLTTRFVVSIVAPLNHRPPLRNLVIMLGEFKLNVAGKSALDRARSKHSFIADKWISVNTPYEVVKPLVIMP